MKFFIGAIALAVLASCGTESGTESTATEGAETEEVQEGHEGHDHGATDDAAQDQDKKNAKDDMNALDRLMGTYESKNKCKDCEEATRQITLSSDMTYNQVTKYANAKKADAVMSGNFKWIDKNEGTIIIDPDSKTPQRFKVDGKVMKNFDTANEFPVLTKVSDTMDLGHNKWLLKTLNGTAIDPSKEGSHAVLFFGDDQTARGNAGCNSFNGAYKNSEADGSIKIGTLAMTKKMCGNMGVEDEFVATLSKVNNYKIEGGKLHLYHNKEASAMVFEPLK